MSDLDDETGEDDATYCYCSLDGYKPLNGTMQSISSSWVGYKNYEDAVDCTGNCAFHCATALTFSYNSEDLALRNSLFSSITQSPAQCSANTITINWSDVDQQYAGQNNEGTATYGGNINTPFKAATKPGQRFTGWRFSAPTPASVEPEEP